MKPELGESEDDALVQLLRALPREDLDAARSERLRRNAHAELRRSVAPTSGVLRALEPLLLAACGALLVARFAFVLALLWQAAH
jgi:hypothetical protein